MKNPFAIGARQHFCVEVSEAMFARFESGQVHAVYSTFYLAKHAEWSCRLFALDMIEAGEEGIGIHISIDHIAPALLGERVDFVAILEAVEGRELWCCFEARVAERLIAKGRTGQKIIKKQRFAAYLATLKEEQA